MNRNLGRAGALVLAAGSLVPLTVAVSVDTANAMNSNRSAADAGRKHKKDTPQLRRLTLTKNTEPFPT